MFTKAPIKSFIDGINHRFTARGMPPQSEKAKRSARQIDITLKMMLIGSLLLIFLSLQFGKGWELAVLSCAVIVCGIALLLWRLHRGAIQFATYGLLTLLTGIFLVTGLLTTETRGLNPAYFLVLVVVTASLFLSFRGLVMMILVSIVSIVILGVVLTTRLKGTPDADVVQVGLVSATFLLLSTSAVVTFNSRNLQMALLQADAHQQTLITRNAELEMEVIKRQQAVGVADQRSLELQRLLDASRVLATTLDLKPLTRGILSQLNHVIGFDAAMIWEFTSPDHYIILASVPENVDDGPIPTVRSIDERDIHLQSLIETREPVLIDDILAGSTFATAQHDRWVRVYGAVPAYLRSSLFLPLLVRDQLIGCIALYSATPGFFTSYLANLGMTFAAQIASAIAVVRSHEKAVLAATYSATMAERSRLARELHDSVSQALFGIVLGANTMLTSADTDRPVTRDSMVYVLHLAQAALSEMRALIFELRPESLQTEGLLNVLRKQSIALAARHKLEVNTYFDEEEPALKPEVKEALYRIALEAIQNVIKHADAQRVDLWLEQGQGRVRLKIQDNGRGFNPLDTFSNHYGLKTIVERAEIFHGSVQFTSQIGQGTCVQVEMPLNA